MAKKIQVQGQVLIITSGNAPTVETLKKGQIAYGTVDGKLVIYGSDGENVMKLSTEGLTTDVTEAIENAVNALKATVDAYTVNGKKISTNPVLTGDDIKATAGTDGAEEENTVTAHLSSLYENFKAAYNLASLNEELINAISESKGAADGLATLDGSGKVPASQLPSYVDDVVDLVAIAATAPGLPKGGDVYYNTADKKLHTAVETSTEVSVTVGWDAGVAPESGKIYINVGDGNKSYRWSGTEMVQIQGGGIVVGTTSGTAFDGAKGAAVEAKAAQNATAITALQTDLNGLTVELTVTEI